MDGTRDLNDRLGGVPFRIAFAGGEPLLYPRLPELVRHAQRLDVSDVEILTNGTLLTPKLADELASFDNIRIQISVEGPPSLNDSVRGRNTSAMIKKAASLLDRKEIPYWFSMTVGRHNLSQVAKTVEWCSSIGNEAYVAFTRFVSTSNSEFGKETILDRTSTLRFFKTVRSLERRAKISTSNCSMTNYLCWKGAQSNSKKICDGCIIGAFCVTVDERGHQITCPKARIDLGDIKKHPLADTFLAHPVLEKFRERNFGACGRCRFKNSCGGCRGISLALKKNVFGQDDTCPLLPVRH